MSSRTLGAALAGLTVVTLSACGAPPEHPSAVRVSPAGVRTPATRVAGQLEVPDPHLVRVALDPRDVVLSDTEGSGAALLPAFVAADYRMLVSCDGDHALRIVAGTRVITSTPCDGLVLDAKVAAYKGTKRLGVDSTKGTRWHVRIARAGEAAP